MACVQGGRDRCAVRVFYVQPQQGGAEMPGEQRGELAAAAENRRAVRCALRADADRI